MFKMLRKKRNNKGFTLIELVVVIAILGILAALAIPRLTGARNDAAKNADAASIRTIQSAISLAEASGALDLDKDSTAPTAATIKTAIIPAYLAEMPNSQVHTADTAGWVIEISGGNTEPYEVKVTNGATGTTGWTNAD